MDYHAHEARAPHDDGGAYEALARAAGAPDAGPPALLDAASARLDNFTPAKQAEFLRALAEGCSADQAARRAGVSRSSAYNLRNRQEGAAFAAAWNAALLRARHALADETLSRAIHGYSETVERDGVVVTRHRYDNRHSRAMLTRLDKLADARAEDALARKAAAEFGAFVEAIAGDSSEQGRMLERFGNRPTCPSVNAAAPSRPSFEFLEEEDCWNGEEPGWWTDAPAPPGFDGEFAEDGWRPATDWERAAFDLDATRRALDEEERAAEAETYRAWLASEGVEWSPGDGDEDDVANVEAGEGSEDKEEFGVDAPTEMPLTNPVMPDLIRHPPSFSGCERPEEKVDPGSSPG